MRNSHWLAKGREVMCSPAFRYQTGDVINEETTQLRCYAAAPRKTRKLSAGEKGSENYGKIRA